MFENCRILIVEQEFLIALDMQRILETAGAKGVVTARSAAEIEALAPHLTDFDLALISLPRERDAMLARAAALRHAGIALVFASTEGHQSEDLSDFPSAAFIGKPFAEDELVEACRRALNPAGQ